jgi:hypothetical protein
MDRESHAKMFTSVQWELLISSTSVPALTYDCFVVSMRSKRARQNTSVFLAAWITSCDVQLAKVNIMTKSESVQPREVIRSEITPTLFTKYLHMHTQNHVFPSMSFILCICHSSGGVYL